MYPVLKFLYVNISSKFKPKVAPFDKIKTKLWVGLTDIDFYFELNNGRQLQICDLGRSELGVRSGINKIAMDNKWAFMIASTQAKYRHRLTLFQSYTLETKMVGYDERWFYFHQQMVRKGKVHSQFMLRTAVICKKGLVPSREVISKIGLEWNPPSNKFITEIQDSQWLK